MLITVAVLTCAFWLSFNALRSVGVDRARVDPRIASMMPVCIELSIAGSTLALLSLSRSDALAKPVSAVASSTTNGSVSAPLTSGLPSAPVTTNGHHAARIAEAQQGDTQPKPPVAPPATNGHASAGQLSERLAVQIHPEAEAEARLRPLADNLVRQKRTKIEPAVVAKVLALGEAQTPPSKIGRLLNVHHSAVRRILESAD